MTTLLNFRGIRFRQAINARTDMFWPFIIVTPMYAFAATSNLWAGVVGLALLMLPMVMLYIKWRLDNRARSHWWPAWPPREQEPPHHEDACHPGCHYYNVKLPPRITTWF